MTHSTVVPLASTTIGPSGPMSRAEFENTEPASVPRTFGVAPPECVKASLASSSSKPGLSAEPAYSTEEARNPSIVTPKKRAQIPSAMVDLRCAESMGIGVVVEIMTIPYA